MSVPSFCYLLLNFPSSFPAFPHKDSDGTAMQKFPRSQIGAACQFVISPLPATMRFDRRKERRKRRKGKEEKRKIFFVRWRRRRF